MRNRKNYLLLMMFFVNIVFSQVGIGTTNPRGALDINKETTNNMGLVLPTNANPNNLINPMGGNVAIGTIMYDSTLSCVRVFKSTGWSNCLCDQCGPTPGFTLDCSSGALSGTFTAGAAGSGSKVINYTNATGQSYGAISIASTGVTGLTATAPAGTLANGNGSITLTISGTPSAAGTANFTVTIAGQSCSFAVNVSGGGNNVDRYTVIQIGSSTNELPNGIPVIGTEVSNGGTGSGNVNGPGATVELLRTVLSDLGKPVEFLGLIPDNNAVQGLTKIFTNTTADGIKREVVFIYSGYNASNQTFTSSINSLIDQYYVSKGKIYFTSADEGGWTSYPYFSTNNYGKTDAYLPNYNVDGTKLIESGEVFPTKYGNVTSSGVLNSRYWGNSLVPPSNAVIVSNIISSDTSTAVGAPIIFKDMNYNGKVWVFGDTDAYWQRDVNVYGAQPYLGTSCTSNDRQRFTCNMFHYVTRKNLGLPTN
ncbi:MULTISPECIES: hypothetical protein [unclassified Chryseobacterium]|uniref:hypothetical protein n=1 Tax=unclassified Chryseobacterium TaxID=2593645 RepID=UPI000F446EFC|nr:hypothetical protein [Chryseobacterium sp. G0240]ROI02132.1 hypothetical protein EGI16_14720 [Chryseobacterium sp. G0240]